MLKGSIWTYLFSRCFPGEGVIAAGQRLECPLILRIEKCCTLLPSDPASPQLPTQERRSTHLHSGWSRRGWTLGHKRKQMYQGSWGSCGHRSYPKSTRPHLQLPKGEGELQPTLTRVEMLLMHTNLGLTTKAAHTRGRVFILLAHCIKEVVEQPKISISKVHCKLHFPWRSVSLSPMLIWKGNLNYINTTK